jgi:hypothetical protein
LPLSSEIRVEPKKWKIALFLLYEIERKFSEKKYKLKELSN